MSKRRTKRRKRRAKLGPTAAAPSRSAARRGRSFAEQRIRATYDAAAHDSAAGRDWEHVDSLSVNAADTPEVLATLRRRGRHEMLNNPFMDGIIQTLSGDVISPQLRLSMSGKNTELNTFIEREVARWMEAVGLLEALQLSLDTNTAQGEVFGRKFSNPRLPTPVKLDMRLYEGDQVASPDFFARRTSDDIDGIIYDRWGNPAFYQILLAHPGDNGFLSFTASQEAEMVPASDVMHLFKKRRPGQRRGLPRIMSSLGLFSQRRSMRQSVLIANRAAAQMGAFVLETELDADVNPYSDAERDDPELDPGTELELSKGMLTTLPRGTKAHQMRPEQPGTNHKDFDRGLVTESARPLGMPANIAGGDSSGYNFASGRLDHQTYDRAIAKDRAHVRRVMLDPLLRSWLEEALTVPGYMPRRARQLLVTLPHTWLWSRRPHVDPAKEANAQSMRLANGTTTITRELAEDGVDFEEHMAQLIKERDAYRAAGLRHPAEAESPELLDDDDALAERMAEINGNGNGRTRQFAR